MTTQSDSDSANPTPGDQGDDAQDTPSFLPSESPSPGRKEDLLLVEQAVRNRWPIPEEYRSALVNRLLAIALAKDSSNREALSATRTLLLADRLNLIGDDEAPTIEGKLSSASAKLGVSVQDIINGSDESFDFDDDPGGENDDAT